MSKDLENEADKNESSLFEGWDNNWNSDINITINIDKI